MLVEWELKQYFRCGGHLVSLLKPTDMKENGFGRSALGIHSPAKENATATI